MQWLAGPISRVYAEATETEVLGKGLINSIAATIRCTSGGVVPMPLAGLRQAVLVF